MWSSMRPRKSKLSCAEELRIGLREALQQGFLSSELAVGSDDGEVGVVESGVVGRAVAELEAADVELAKAFQRLLELRPRRVRPGAAQAFDQHLAADVPFEHRRRHFGNAFGLGVVV